MTLKNRFLLFGLCTFSTLVFGQMRSPCITSKGEIDLACSCQAQKKCMGTTSKSDQLYLQKLNTQVGNNHVNQILQVAKPGRDFADALMSGKIDPAKFNPTAVQRSNDKLKQVNEKLSKVVEAKYRQMGMKNYKLKDRAAIIDKKIDAAIHPKVRQLLEKDGIKLDFKALGLGDSENFPTIPTVPSIANSRTGSASAEQPELLAELEAQDESAVKIPIEIDESEKEKLAIEATLQRDDLDFKDNSIHQDSSKNIWSIISMKYAAKKGGLLGSHIYEEPLKPKFLEGMKKDISFLVNQF